MLQGVRDLDGKVHPVVLEVSNDLHVPDMMVEAKVYGFEAGGEDASSFGM